MISYKTFLFSSLYFSKTLLFSSPSQHVLDDFFVFSAVFQELRQVLELRIHIPSREGTHRLLYVLV